jgi:hypothetical protein
LWDQARSRRLAHAGRSGGRPRHKPWDRGWSGTRPRFTLRRPSRAAPEPSPPVRLKKPCARRLSGSSLLTTIIEPDRASRHPRLLFQARAAFGPQPEDACLFQAQFIFMSAIAENTSMNRIGRPCLSPTYSCFCHCWPAASIPVWETSGFLAFLERLPPDETAKCVLDKAGESCRAQNEGRRNGNNEKTKDHRILLFPKVMGFSHLGGRAAVLYRTACPKPRLKLRHSL